MEDLLIRKNLRWARHLLRMPADRLTRQVLYSQLPDGQRPHAAHVLMLDGDGSMGMVYLDFSNALDNVDHDIIPHKLKLFGITGNLGMWFYNFPTHQFHFVRLTGGISVDSPVLNGI